MILITIGIGIGLVILFYWQFAKMMDEIIEEQEKDGYWK